MPTSQESAPDRAIVVGILALQGAFREHRQLLQQAVLSFEDFQSISWTFKEVRNSLELSQCDALIIPGGESTTMALVAANSGLLEPLRQFVKVDRKPTWGTCAGIILLAESANRTKKGGQELIGGLDVRVNRNHFGRQTESFETDLELLFLKNQGGKESLFRGIFIRAPIVEKVLPIVSGEQAGEAKRGDTVIAPVRVAKDATAAEQVNQPVEVLARLPNRTKRAPEYVKQETGIDPDAGDIIAVRQGNVFGTSFHPELTQDPRIHIWWLENVKSVILSRRVS